MTSPTWPAPSVVSMAPRSSVSVAWCARQASMWASTTSSSPRILPMHTGHWISPAASLRKNESRDVVPELVVSSSRSRVSSRSLVCRCLRCRLMSWIILVACSTLSAEPPERRDLRALRADRRVLGPGLVNLSYRPILDKAAGVYLPHIKLVEML